MTDTNSVQRIRQTDSGHKAFTVQRILRVKQTSTLRPGKVDR